MHLRPVTTDASDSQKSLRIGNSDAERSPLQVASSADGHATGVEAWVNLCARAAIEKDPKRLLELVKEINRLLDVRRQRLIHETAQNSPNDGSTGSREPELR
jgi:hypothetical protein